MISIATTVFKKLYWLAVACIPVVPLYVLGTYDSDPVCSDSGICVHFGHMLTGVEQFAVLVTIVLLWPMCAWQLVGKYFWSHLRPTPTESSQ
jgi:hypothetical protein